MERDRDDDLDREIRTHLDLEAEDRVENGMSETEARSAARRAFGNVTRTKEDARAVSTWRPFDETVQDVRYAVRTLRKRPGFAFVAVLTLALGIGANTATFSLINAVILQPLGYPQPQQLMFLGTGSGGPAQGSLSTPEYFELTELSQSFAALGAFTAGAANLSIVDRPRRVTRASVDTGLLEALAVPPVRGRWFRREETRLGGPRVVLLSYELWRSAFAAREDMVGQAIDLNGAKHEVVGIMPAGFDLMDRHAELWLPLQLDPAARQYRSSHFLSVVGRLKHDVSQQQAEAELASLMASWGARTGASGHVFTPGEHIIQMEPMLDQIVGSARRVFWVLQAVAGMVLLIACVNLANLLMVRAEVRRREVAVRTAIGAGRRRLAAQFIVEGVVLSACGGAAGLVVARLGLGAFRAAYPETLPRVADIAIDPTVLGFTMLVSVVTGVVFGLAPLYRLSESTSGRVLNDRAVGATAARSSVRSALVAGEVAAAVVLVVGAGLMVRTVLNLMTVDAGFDRSRLVTFAVALPAASYARFDQRVDLYRRLLDRFRATPGISSVALVSGLPPQRGANGFGTDIEDHAPPPDVADAVDYYQTVTSGSFDAMRIPIVRGRAFEDADRTGAPVAIVNEAFVRTFWHDLEPIGRRVKPRFGDQTPWVTVVGVAKDVKQAGVDRVTGTEVYFLLEQLPRIFPTIPPTRFGDWWGDGSMHIMLRSALPAVTLQPSIVAAVREADPSLPIIRLRDMEDVFRDSFRRPLMLMQLLAGFAGLALLLATIGTYGVLSYMVALRQREIGIRMALGAERATVLRQVLGHGLKLTALGLVSGLAAAVLLTRFVETLLFDVRPHDPATLVGVGALITAVATAASLVPAVRATRVDPIVAIREE